jgi:hypothetical protein
LSRGGDTRFAKGQSGNPAGRPKKRRPHISAFDIIFDKTLTVTQGGVERELTVDEALQLQTYQAALKGSKMAVRAVLKMIEKREVALAAKHLVATRPIEMKHRYSSDNARRALEILDIAVPDPGLPSAPAETRRMMLRRWAAQAGLSRPGRKQLSERDVTDIKFFTLERDKLRWPKGRIR